VSVVLLSAGQEGPASDGEYPVVLDARRLFTIKVPRAPYTAQQRAKNISDDLLAVAEDEQVRTADMRIVPLQTDSLLLAGHTFVLAVTDEDAQADGVARQELIGERKQIIERAIAEYRRARAPLLIARNVAFVVAYWAIVAVLLVSLARLNRSIAARLQRRYQQALEARNLGVIDSLFGKQLYWTMNLVLKLGKVVVAVIVVSVALSHTLSHFPQTAGVSRALVEFRRSTLALVAKKFLAYLPNLAVILLVIAATYCLIRIFSALSRALGSGAIALPGFHKEWVEPTHKILTFVSVMFALVVIFPYLPGSNSPAFQGASIFIGVLVTLGSSSVMGSVIAGIILTYMRPFQVGDRVRISDTVGDVVERSLLVTRLRTVKNVTTIIPNSMILGAHILNYSAESKLRGLIVHTSVTIGYDAPWRTVHQLLIKAALATKGVRSEPLPFVVQTGLNNSYVGYEINAFTDLPNEMHLIFSRLHENIQEEFNRAGVEILSPTYLSMRDGNAVTIPEAQRPPGYTAPGFRVHVESDGKRAQSASPVAADQADGATPVTTAA
jgi:small-conductance mechanosensitive channel